MTWEYCTKHRWENIGEYDVELEQKDSAIVTDRHGVEHTLLRGQALERQRQRTSDKELAAIFDDAELEQSESFTEEGTEEVWTQEHENVWYTAYVIKFDEHYWFAKFEGSDSVDSRNRRHDYASYRIYVHSTVVPSGFKSGVVGTKIKVRVRPNRKQGGNVPWEALEAVIEPKDLTAQAEEN